MLTFRIFEEALYLRISQGFKLGNKMHFTLDIKI